MSDAITVRCWCGSRVAVVDGDDITISGIKPAWRQGPFTRLTHLGGPVPDDGGLNGRGLAYCEKDGHPHQPEDLFKAARWAKNHSRMTIRLQGPSATV